MTEDEMKEKCYVFVPYICAEHTEESLKTYNEFMTQYRTQHKYCPKCGTIEHKTTLLGYVLNWDKKEDYKDMNRCECMKCGDIHSTHDRVHSNITHINKNKMWLLGGSNK